ncbi:MAG TPA: RecX family transcriptional regulator [Fimbriimonadaceae bacterium]|nr:RecX family transcriptional regulator [Fimbriimonadaceae bacterium]
MKPDPGPPASFDAPGQAALLDAFRFLKTRDRMESEVRAHLCGHAHDAKAIESVVKFLMERKLINDDKTTQSLIERNSGKRAVGIERLKAELERLGAPEESIERYLAEGPNEGELALEALRAKYKTKTSRAKAGRFLYGRGFSEEAVESALDAFCGQDTFPD